MILGAAKQAVIAWRWTRSGIDGREEARVEDVGFARLMALACELFREGDTMEQVTTALHLRGVDPEVSNLIAETSLLIHADAGSGQLVELASKLSREGSTTEQVMASLHLRDVAPEVSQAIMTAGILRYADHVKWSSETAEDASQLLQRTGLPARTCAALIRQMRVRASDGEHLGWHTNIFRLSAAGLALLALSVAVALCAILNQGEILARIGLSLLGKAWGYVLAGTGLVVFLIGYGLFKALGIPLLRSRKGAGKWWATSP
jgi:hypothetical protein